MINKELKFIADHYGLENQLGKCIEEFNELVEALNDK
nr:MAG TPA: triphosphate pyrophosphohydrolase [Caudoviricetes sp.]